MEEKMENKSIREFAIEFETKGTNLYLSLASETTSILGKELFYNLAQQEVQHAWLFDRMYSLTTHENLPLKDIGDIESNLKEFWENAEKTELKKEPGDLSGYILAMDMEKQSISAYQNFLNQSKEDREKDFLKWIIEEEKKHLEALNNVYHFLSDTGDWYQAEESKKWNWMNQ